MVGDVSGGVDGSYYDSRGTAPELHVIATVPTCTVSHCTD
jgi:hypothetical protein